MTTETLENENEIEEITPTPATAMFVPSTMPAMEIHMNLNNLRAAVADVAKFTSSGKSTLAVLSFIHIVAKENGGVEVQATNLEVGITKHVQARVIVAGDLCVPAKLFNEYLAKFPADRTVKLISNPTTAQLRVEISPDPKVKNGKSSSADIACIEGSEFPVIPKTGFLPVATFELEKFIEVSSSVAMATATDDTRPVLTGMYFHFKKNGTVTFAAADGFRLVVRNLSGKIEEDAQSIIVPGRAMNAMTAVFGKYTGLVEMLVGASGGQVLFRTIGDGGVGVGVEFVSRVIEGKFPDYNRIQPANFTSRWLLDTDEFITGVKICALFAAASANILKLNCVLAEDGNPAYIEMSANAAQVGDNKHPLQNDVIGFVSPDTNTNPQIAVNTKFLAEALATFATYTDRVAIEMQTPQSPLVIKPVGTNDEGHICLIMPMTIR